MTGLAGGCHCGAVTIAVAGAPDAMNQCNCTFCFSHGTLWGYFPADGVSIAGATTPYMRADSATGAFAFHFCGRCGATTHWAPAAGHRADRRGVNMRLFDPAALAGITVRYGDRRTGPATEPRRHYREPTIFDGAGAAP